MFRLILLLAAGCFWAMPASASQIHLKNGDRITGQVLEDGETYYKIKTVLLGDISINKDLVSGIVSDEDAQAQAEAEAAAPASAPAPASAEPPAPKVWTHNIAAGYTTTNGNNKTDALNVTADSQYNKGRNLWKIKNVLDYASSDGKMSVQKYFGKAQSDYRFSDTSRWFYTRSVELTHDKFANIDYRVLPALGIGYWFWEGDRSKSELDIGLGYEYTNYNTTDTKSTGNMSMIPHYYIDKVIFGKSKLSEDITIYPSLESLADYRLRSETAFVNPISNTMSWKLSFVDEFNSSPAAGAKKNDTTFISSLQVSF